jgi:[ribosomal protein S5]-alanine N-acetyltransferase
VKIALKTCLLRTWQASDLNSLVEHANSSHVWMNLRDQFPHPYMRRDGRTFLRHMRARRPETVFAIDVGGKAVGAIGFVLQKDVDRVSAEVGYWLGEQYWGRGIASEALGAITRHAIETHGLTRVFAVPFAYNQASCRVLEKNGYVLEGCLRRSAIKNGQIVDQFQYAFIAGPSESSRRPRR